MIDQMATDLDEMDKIVDEYYQTIAAQRTQIEDLVSAAKEVLRISDRKHEAWDRLRVAIAKAEGGNAG